MALVFDEVIASVCLSHTHTLQACVSLIRGEGCFHLSSLILQLFLP